MKKLITLGIGAAVILLLNGCAGTQPIPQAVQNGKFKTPRGGKGMLYVYRPSSFVGGAVYYDIHDGGQKDKVIGTITSGSVIAKELRPGKREIWAKTEAKAGVPITISKGGSQCIVAGVSMGLFIGRPTLQKTDMQTCKYEIKKIIAEKKKRAAQAEKEKSRKDSIGLPI